MIICTFTSVSLKKKKINAISSRPSWTVTIWNVLARYLIKKTFHVPRMVSRPTIPARFWNFQLMMRIVFGPHSLRLQTKGITNLFKQLNDVIFSKLKGIELRASKELTLITDGCHWNAITLSYARTTLRKGFKHHCLTEFTVVFTRSHVRNLNFPHARMANCLFKIFSCFIGYLWLEISISLSMKEN